MSEGSSSWVLFWCVFRVCAWVFVYFILAITLFAYFRGQRHLEGCFRNTNIHTYLRTIYFYFHYFLFLYFYSITSWLMLANSRHRYLLLYSRGFLVRCCRYLFWFFFGRNKMFWWKWNNNKNQNEKKNKLDQNGIKENCCMCDFI